MKVSGTLDRYVTETAKHEVKKQVEINYGVDLQDVISQAGESENGKENIGSTSRSKRKNATSKSSFLKKISSMNSTVDAFQAT